MATNNKKLAVTHTQILCWAITQQETQRKEEVHRLTRLEEADTEPALKASLGDSLRESIDQYDQVLEILRQMYEFETGKEYCG